MLVAEHRARRKQPRRSMQVAHEVVPGERARALVEEASASIAARVREEMLATHGAVRGLAQLRQVFRDRVGQLEEAAARELVGRDRKRQLARATELVAAVDRQRSPLTDESSAGDRTRAAPVDADAERDARYLGLFSNSRGE